jgi:serine/threonine-protein kinase
MVDIQETSDMVRRLADRLLEGHLRREDVLDVRLFARAASPEPGPADHDASARPTVVLPQSSSGLAIGRRFGRYEIEQLLGRGAMGAAYLARQVDLDRAVVVKVLAGDRVAPEHVERMRREALAMAQVASDHVVKVFEVGTEDGAPFLAMEYVDGASLDARIVAGAPLPFEEATRIAIEAARGLLAAHEAGILHRDVKPGNLLLTREGRVKVSDFGLAKAEGSRGTGSSLTQVGMVVGTPDYMAPEQAEGEALDGRADVYALGSTYYQLLTGRLPFVGRSVLDVLAQKLASPPTSPREVVPGVPEAIDRACLVLMARWKEERPPMRDALARLESAFAAASGTPFAKSLAVPRLVAGSVLQATLRAPEGAASSGSGERPPASGSGAPALAVPGPFGPYALERVLGRGGMGTTYLARQRDLDRAVVVKVMNEDGELAAEAIERFRREAKAAAQVASDHAVKLYDAGVEGGVPYIAMEYVDGVSATALLATRGRCRPLEATSIVLAAARGLKAAHDVGVLHRDVKPANILIDRAGRVKIADFGLAKIGPSTSGRSTVQNLTLPGTVLGTAAYMSPEQIRGEAATPRSDIYSLGVAYYELLTGKLPWDGASDVQLLAARRSPVVPPRKRVAGIPLRVERACLSFMAEDTASRPASMEAVVETLARLAGSLDRMDALGHQGPSEGDATGQALERFASSVGHARAYEETRRGARAWALAALFAACAVTGVVVLGVARSPGRPAPTIAPAPPPPEATPPPSSPSPPAESPAPPPPASEEDDAAERDAAFALDAARLVAPAESVARLDRIPVDFKGSKAASLAAFELVAVKNLADELAAAADATGLAIESHDPDAADRLLAAFLERIESFYGPHLERTGSAPAHDGRLEAARAWAAAARARVGLERDLGRALSLGLPDLRAACLEWRTKPAEETLGRLRELDARSRAAAPKPRPEDTRIADFAAALATVDVLKRVTHAPPGTRGQVAQVARDLAIGRARLDDATRLAVLVVASYLKQGLPTVFALETGAAKARLASILKLIAAEAPPLEDLPGSRPQGPGDGRPFGPDGPPIPDGERPPPDRPPPGGGAFPPGPPEGGPGGDNPRRGGR